MHEDKSKQAERQDEVILLQMVDAHQIGKFKTLKVIKHRHERTMHQVSKITRIITYSFTIQTFNYEKK